MNRSQILASARLAGQVQRYHTWPVHRQQSVAEHTWQVMRVWYAIWGPMPPEVSTYLLWHDAGELVTGDLPFPVKAHNPAIKEPLDCLERRAIVSMGGPEQHSLSEEDVLRAKCADLLEMWEFGLSEWQLGNAYARPIIVDMREMAEELVRRMSSEDRRAVASYMMRLTEAREVEL